MKAIFLVSLCKLFMVAYGFISLPSPPLPDLKPPFSKPDDAIGIDNCHVIVDEFPGSLKSLKHLFDQPLCVQLSKKKLIELLKKIGDFNPRYMATSFSEALHFPDLTNSENVREARRKRDTYYMPEKPQKGEHVNEEPKLRRERRALSQPGILLRSCFNKGTFVGRSNLRRMCTACPATTRLSADVFPPFINEVVCLHGDLECLPRVGRCSQGALLFTFLRKTGNFVRDKAISNALGVNIYMEEWKEFTQNVRSCCDCLALPALNQQGRK